MGSRSSHLFFLPPWSHRRGRACRPHRPSYYHPPQEYQRDHGKKRGHHGVCGQCKVPFYHTHTRVRTQIQERMDTRRQTWTAYQNVPALRLIFCSSNDSPNLSFEHDGGAFCTSLFSYLFRILPFDFKTAPCSRRLARSQLRI